MRTVLRHRDRAAAFTLVELVAVIAILAVLGAVAVGSFGQTTASRRIAVARALARDLTHAREQAIARGVGTWVWFEVVENRYTLLVDSSSVEGRASANTLTDPATGGEFVVRLGSDASAGVMLSSVSVPGGGADLGFDWKGRPLDSSGDLLTSDATITLTGGGTVVVKAGSGLAVVP